jgi:hypothetical protein
MRHLRFALPLLATFAFAPSVQAQQQGPVLFKGTARVLSATATQARACDKPMMETGTVLQATYRPKEHPANGSDPTYLVLHIPQMMASLSQESGHLSAGSYRVTTVFHDGLSSRNVAGSVTVARQSPAVVRASTTSIKLDATVTNFLGFRNCTVAFTVHVHRCDALICG